jgi:hypothetical protein
MQERTDHCGRKPCKKVPGHKGEKLPTMKEVTMELEAVQMLQKAPKLQQNYNELEYV